jgi:hypothetical protein
VSLRRLKALRSGDSPAIGAVAFAVSSRMVAHSELGRAEDLTSTGRGAFFSKSSVAAPASTLERSVRPSSGTPRS